MRRLPRDEIDSKAIKQIVTGQYGYALNALWQKQDFKKALYQKVAGDVLRECEQLCSLGDPSLLRDATPNGLKSFTETAHLAELQRRAPILLSILQASTSTRTTGKSESTHGVSPDCAVSMAASVLLHARCPQMSAQSYRLALVLWHSGARKQVCMIYFYINKQGHLAS